MFKRTTTPTRIPDRLSYLWLAIAAALFVFYAGRLAIPLAAWLAPLFLLRFVRTQRPLPGLLLAWLVRFAVAAVVPSGLFLLSGIGYYALVLLLAGLSMLPYLADRLLTPRLQGFVATLVFPLAFTTFEYLSSFSPTGMILHCEHPVWQLATYASGVGNRDLGPHLFDHLVRGGGQLGVGTGFCLAPGAKRCAAVCCHPRCGAPGWGRTAGALPAGNDHCPRRGSQCFAGGCRHVDQQLPQATLSCCSRQGHPG